VHLPWLREAIICYFSLATIFFYIFYSEGCEDMGRFNWIYKNDRGLFVCLWRGCVVAPLRCFREDFFLIHCPWNKNTSVRYRVLMAHSLLQNNKHEKGWRAEDCHNSKNHEQIAKDCFESRTKFWFKSAFAFLTMPPRGVLFVLVQLILILFFVSIRNLLQRASRTF